MKPIAVFIIGAPASGKSTIRDHLFKGQEGWVFIDCDIVKEEHRDYDPKNPDLLAKLHPWSAAESRRRYLMALASKRNVVVEGTASNTEEFAGLLDLAKEAGYYVKLVYVECSLATVLRRNTVRQRTVNDSLVREKYAQTLRSIEIVSNHADEAETILNDLWWPE